jgi:hypothetical protein
MDKQVRFYMGIVGKAKRFKKQVYIIIEIMFKLNAFTNL